MAATILLYLTTISITHYVASFIQAALHYLLGHRAIGGFLNKIHIYEHHGIYSKDLLVSEKYLDEEKSADYYYAIPAIILATSAYLLFPFDVFLIHISSLGLSTYAHLYLHIHYHLEDSWLKRFGWFQNKQRLHLLHHKNTAKNYAVIEFCWDRVFGTYEDIPSAVKS